MGNVSRSGIWWFKGICCTFLKWCCQRLQDSAEVGWCGNKRDCIGCIGRRLVLDVVHPSILQPTTDPYHALSCVGSIIHYLMCYSLFLYVVQGLVLAMLKEGICGLMGLVVTVHTSICVKLLVAKPSYNCCKEASVNITREV